jgi:SPW repeat
VSNWIVAALGLWALVSPFVLHFSGATIAMRNNVIIGAAITILTIWLAANPWRHQHRVTKEIIRNQSRQQNDKRYCVLCCAINSRLLFA